MAQEIYLKLNVEDGDAAIMAALADSVAEEEGVIDVTVLSEPHVVIAGDPFSEGLSIKGGIFEGEDEATDFANDEFDGEPSFVVPVNTAS